MENTTEPLGFPQKPSLYSKLHSRFKKILKNIFVEDLLITVLLLILFGTIYLFLPKKLTDSSIIFPLQKVSAINGASSGLETKGLGNKEIIGFLPSWTVAANVKVNIKELTQLIYFGLGVNGNGEIVRYKEDNTPVLEWHYFNSQNFADIKKEAKENGTKTLISFKLFNNEDLDNLVSNSLATNYFIKNSIALLKKYDLDGINLDIEYFSDSDFPTVKYLNMFVDKVSKALKESDPSFLLSIDVNATVVLSDKAYDMVKIGEAADQVIIMAYDYHMPSSTMAGPVAPIDAPENAHSVRKSIMSLSGRVPFEKVILGIPLYGYEWQTVNKNYKSNTIAGTGALATLKRVGELLDNREDIEIHWNKESMSPWLVYSQSGAIKQVYYENKRSLQAKVDFVKENNLGGVSVWALGYEGSKDKEVWDIFKK